MSDKKTKKNDRTSYMMGRKGHKRLQIWIPSNIDTNDYENPFVLLLSQLSVFAKEIDTSLYENNFELFYEFHIDKYDNRIQDHYFCASPAGGVNKEYIIETANENDTATLVSMDVADNGEILEVYAIASFNMSDTNMEVHVATLCGNQMLPPSGEGSRLLKLIEETAYKVGIPAIILDPIDTAVPFYKVNKYRDITPDDSDDEKQMKKNVRAIKNWKKVRAHIDMLSLFKQSKIWNAKRAIHKELFAIKESKQRRLPMMTGKPINIPGTSLRPKEYDTTNKSDYVPPPKQKGTRIVIGSTLNYTKAKGIRTKKIRKMKTKKNR